MPSNRHNVSEVLQFIIRLCTTVIELERVLCSLLYQLSIFSSSLLYVFLSAPIQKQNAGIFPFHVSLSWSFEIDWLLWR